MTFKLDRVPHFVIERTFQFPSVCVTWRKISCSVKIAIIAYVFNNWTVLALEEVSLSIYQNSRAIIFRFNGKAQWQTFLLLSGRHVGAPWKALGPQHGLQSSFPNNAWMKNRTDLNLGEVVCLSIIYHISWLNLLNGYDFYFRCKRLVGRLSTNERGPWERCWWRRTTVTKQNYKRYFLTCCKYQTCNISRNEKLRPPLSSF